MSGHRGLRWFMAAAAVLSAFMCLTVVAQASELSQDNMDSEELKSALIDGFDYSEVDESLKELFPKDRLSFRDTLASVLTGDMKASGKLLLDLVKEQVTYMFVSLKGNLVHILLIAVIAAVFSNFASVFQSRQVSEISFYVVYLLLIALCLNSFGIIIDWTADGIHSLTSFMKVFGPLYFLAVAVAKGSITSVAFYNLVLFLIFLVEVFILNFLLPVIHIYLMVKVLNFLSPEEYLSKLASLLSVVTVWTLKTLLACVVGLNGVQGLISPAIDTVKRSVVTRGAEAIPGIGDAIGGMTEVALGTAVLVKNGIGITGAIISIALCVVPLLQTAFIALLYKLAAAFIQPVSDKRIVGCVESVGDGCELLIRVIFTAGMLFLLSIAVVAACTSQV